MQGKSLPYLIDQVLWPKKGLSVCEKQDIKTDEMIKTKTLMYLVSSHWKTTDVTDLLLIPQSHVFHKGFLDLNQGDHQHHSHLGQGVHIVLDFFSYEGRSAFSAAKHFLWLYPQRSLDTIMRAWAQQAVPSSLWPGFTLSALRPYMDTSIHYQSKVLTHPLIQWSVSKLLMLSTL